VLKKGGQFLIIDLPYHGEEWMRERMGDQWLGFDPKEIIGWLEEFNLDLKHHNIINQDNTIPVMYFSGTKK
jgi:ArsR family transcriptional regulator